MPERGEPDQTGLLGRADGPPTVHLGWLRSAPVRINTSTRSRLRLDSILLVPIVGLGVAGLSLVIGADRGDVRVLAALSGMATFLFGVLLAFTIARTRERLALVQGLIATGNAALFTIYQLTAVYDAEDRERIRTLIDRHLTDQIDYRLADYHRASPSYLELTNAVIALDPGPENLRSNVHKQLVALVIKMGDQRALIESSVGQGMSGLEWAGLNSVLAILLGLIAALPGGGPAGAGVAGVLASSLALLIVLVRRLDGLRWHERSSIWEPTSRLFRNLDLAPYVPAEVIASGRFRPTGHVRVVHYPDPYPTRESKIVKVETF